MNVGQKGFRVQLRGCATGPAWPAAMRALERANIAASDAIISGYARFQNAAGQGMVRRRDHHRLGQLDQAEGRLARSSGRRHAKFVVDRVGAGQNGAMRKPKMT